MIAGGIDLAACKTLVHAGALECSMIGEKTVVGNVKKPLEWNITTQEAAFSENGSSEQPFFECRTQNLSLTLRFSAER